MTKLNFYVGLHHPRRAAEFDLAFISINALAHRPNGFQPNRWVMDSGAFTEVTNHCGYRTGVEEYAAQIRRFARCGHLERAVAQDFMCEAHVCEIVLGLPRGTITAEQHAAQVLVHQRLTVERYDALVACDTAGVEIMPVLQGQSPEDYARHVRMYGDRLKPGAWVGVGSVCKRQGSPEAIIAVLDAILAERPDLRLHGFGVKLTALKRPEIVARLFSADSMAWSFSAKKQGRKGHDFREACWFERRVLDATGTRYGELAQAREEAEWGAIVRAAIDLPAGTFSAALVDLLPPAIGKGDVAKAEAERLPTLAELLASIDAEAVAEMRAAA